MAGFFSLPSAPFEPFRYTTLPFETPEIQQGQGLGQGLALEQPSTNVSLLQNIDFLLFLEMQKQMSAGSQPLPKEQEIEQINSHLSLTGDISLLAILESQKRVCVLGNEIRSLQSTLVSRVTALMPVMPVMPEAEEPRISVSSAEVVKRQLLEIPKRDEPSSTSMIQVRPSRSSSIDELSSPEKPSLEEDSAPKLSRKRNIEELTSDNQFVKKAKRLFSSRGVPLTKEQGNKLNAHYSKQVKDHQRSHNRAETSRRYKIYNRQLEVTQTVFEQSRIIAQQKVEIEQLRKHVKKRT